MAEYIERLVALETQLEGARREAGRTRQQLLRLRQELGILRAARDFNRSQRRTKANMLTGLATAATAGGGISGGALANSKVKFKTGMRPRGPARLHRHRAVGPNQAIGGGGLSPARDDWEDISADRYDTHTFSLSLSPPHYFLGWGGLAASRGHRAYAKCKQMGD